MPVPVPISGPISTPLVRPALVPAPKSLATIPQVTLAAPPVSSLYPYPPQAPVHSVSYSTVTQPQPVHTHSHTHPQRTSIQEVPRIARHSTSPAAVNQDIVRNTHYQRQSGSYRPVYDTRHSLDRPSRSGSRQEYQDDALGLHFSPQVRDLRRSNSDSRHLDRASR